MVEEVERVGERSGDGIFDVVLSMENGDMGDLWMDGVEIVGE